MGDTLTKREYVAIVQKHLVAGLRGFPASEL